MRTPNVNHCPRCTRNTTDELTWPLTICGQIVDGGCQECWEDDCAQAWWDFHTPQPQEEPVKRYVAELIIDGHAEEQALARLVAKMNAESPTPLTIEEVLSSMLYDVLNAETNNAPLVVGALLDEAHAVLAVDPLLAGMALTQEVTQ